MLKNKRYPSILAYAACFWLLFSCKRNDDYLYSNFSINNTTGFAASMKSRVNGEVFALPNNQTTDIRTKTSLPGLFDISSIQTPLRFEAVETGPKRYQLNAYRYDLEYRITGLGATQAADLTWRNAKGGTSQAANVALPASVPITAFDGGFVYISAQSRASSGGITVEIYRNGKPFGTTNTAYGSYAIATTSGTF